MKDFHFSLITFPDVYCRRPGRHFKDGEVPDRLLPGRMLMNMDPEHRAALAKLDFGNVADWWIKVVCGK